MIFLYKTDYVPNTVFLFACLVFVSLADDKNCKEGQVTFLWTTFIKKWKYLLNILLEVKLTPVLGSTLTDLSSWEAAGLVWVTETHGHTMASAIRGETETTNSPSLESQTADSCRRCTRRQATWAIRETCTHEGLHIFVCFRKEESHRDTA